jgi:mitogen-activated protein kinase 15
MHNFVPPTYKQQTKTHLVFCLLLSFFLQPSNVLLNSDCHAKLCDFGLCRSVNELQSPNPALTDYVATRWYRAPEILLGATDYGKSVDTWAVGCVLGEMFNGRAIFPGTSTMNQLERIVEVIGMPNEAEQASIKSPFAKTMLQSLPRVRARNFESMFPNAGQGLDRIPYSFILKIIIQCALYILHIIIIIHIHVRVHVHVATHT